MPTRNSRARAKRLSTEGRQPVPFRRPMACPRFFAGFSHISYSCFSHMAGRTPCKLLSPIMLMPTESHGLTA